MYKLYEGNYKKLLVVPAFLFIILIIAVFFVPTSIDLKGGTSIIIRENTNFSSNDFESFLKNNFSLEGLFVSKSSSSIELEFLIPKEQIELSNQIKQIKSLDDMQGLILAKEFLTNNNISFSENASFDELKTEMDLYSTRYKNAFIDRVLNSLKLEFSLSLDSVNIREVGPTLGESFYRDGLKVFFLSSIFIIIAVFLFFREFIPSAAIILAGVMDVMGGLLGMALFNIPLSLVTIPTLLMLLGYSIDTDVMLTTKLLKRKEGTLMSRTYDALKTGLTMTITTLVAVISMLVFSYFFNINVIFDMAVVLIFGLIFDIISTWFMNAPILLWYIERKG